MTKYFSSIFTIIPRVATVLLGQRVKCSIEPSAVPDRSTVDPLRGRHATVPYHLIEERRRDADVNGCLDARQTSRFDARPGVLHRGVAAPRWRRKITCEASVVQSQFEHLWQDVVKCSTDYLSWAMRPEIKSVSAELMDHSAI